MKTSGLVGESENAVCTPRQNLIRNSYLRLNRDSILLSKLEKKKIRSI